MRYGAMRVRYLWISQSGNMKEGQRGRSPPPPPSRELDGRVELRAVGLNIDVRAANASEDFKVCTAAAAAALFTVQQPDAPRPSLILLPLLFFFIPLREVPGNSACLHHHVGPQHPPHPPLFCHCGLD